ncbi:hypothetical protein [Prevotella pectinovora]|uniref:hypothetical protein n=1 Tax=Prevotella pectinovora TaxID=1602169 RepID=UPI000695B120|nr:hypothetical protein [Prevotella pectinovora]
MEKYNIGQEILKEVKAKYPSVTAFAKDLCKSSSATYEIFGKTSLDTDLLLKVSKLLDRDFFREFSEKCLNGEVAVEDKDMTENHINCLLPEDELHVFTYDKHEMVLEEYFLLPRKKPLVAFCGWKDREEEIKLTCVIGENIFGKGMVRSLRVDSNNLADLEAQIPILTSIPQKAFVILYRGRGLDNGYDYVILLTEKLLAASGKHVVLICSNRNWVSITNDKAVYSSNVEPTFDTWKDRIFACVLDNSQNDFVYNRELYYAIKGCGYIDAISCCLGLGTSGIDEEKVKQLIAEAKEKLSTFKDTIIKEDEERERHLISSLVVRPEDKKFERYMSKDSVSIWIDISKATGTILDWQGSFKSMIFGDDPWYSDAPM